MDQGVPIREVRPARARWLLAAIVAALALALANEDTRERLERLLGDDSQALPSENSSTPDSASANAAAVAPAPALVRDGEGCLVPPELAGPIGAPQPEELVDWHPAGAGDRLRVDPCGNLWALWFNSWIVYPRDGPAQSAYLNLPDSAASRSGVAGFASLRNGDFWFAARDGQVLRFRGNAWQSMPARPSCVDPDLAYARGRLWIACGRGTGLAAWDEANQNWEGITDSGIDSPKRFASGSDGLLFVAGDDGLVELSDSGWRRLADLDDPPTALAVDNDRIVVGGAHGVRWFTRDGAPLGEALNGSHVTGIALGASGAWVSVRNEGLHHFDGTSWRAWRYAQGLADDEARDVVIDADDRLWLGGSTMGVIGQRAALARLFELATPAAQPGALYPDACAAVRAQLREASQSGQLAQHTIDGALVVFFGTRQACPDPHQLPHDAPRHFRRADGAVLAVGYNGLRGNHSCGMPCGAEQRAQLAKLWKVEVLEPGGKRRVLPLPEPFPD